jgi:hypothetical protein
MKKSTRFAIVIACVVSLSSCSTTIIDSLRTTVPGPTTSTTLPIPTGDIPSLLAQLSDVTVGLGQAIVDGDSKTYQQRVVMADSIWKVLEPQVRTSGLDLVEDIQRTINLIHTAAERKRPADADKASRFITIIKDSAESLLKK